MTAQAASSITSAPLLQARNNLIIHQALTPQPNWESQTYLMVGRAQRRNLPVS
jgi:hypothetical protein